MNYLNELVGHGFRLDRLPELLDPAAPGAGGLAGGDEPRQPNRAYYIQAGERRGRPCALSLSTTIGCHSSGFPSILMQSKAG